MRRNPIEARAQRASGVLHSHINKGGSTGVGIRLLIKTLLLAIPAQFLDGLLKLWAGLVDGFREIWAGLVALCKGLFWAFTLLAALIFSPLLYVALAKEAARVKALRDPDDDF